MRYTIDKQQREFFQKNGTIEFEGVFTLDQISALNKAIDQTLAVRCQVPLEKVPKCTPEQMFLAGRDLWRDNIDLRKFDTHERLTEIVSELVEQHPFRLGYDQLFPNHTVSKLKPKLQWTQETNSQYNRFLNQSASIDEVSCFDGILCGVLLPLTESPASENSLFSAKPGNAVFFQPQIPISFDYLLQHFDQRFFLIVYAQMNATYSSEKKDPHKHLLKHLGYRHGERLMDKYHLVVAR